jgi:hypothetical protein
VVVFLNPLEGTVVAERRCLQLSAEEDNRGDRSSLPLSAEDSRSVRKSLQLSIEENSCGEDSREQYELRYKKKLY